MFREAWSHFDPRGTCYIKTTDLLPLIALISPPLGNKDKPELNLVFAMWSKNIELSVYKDNYYHFYEVAFSLSKRIYEE